MPERLKTEEATGKQPLSKLWKTVVDTLKTGSPCDLVIQDEKGAKTRVSFSRVGDTVHWRSGENEGPYQTLFSHVGTKEGWFEPGEVQ
ncbi:hypothetical protein A3C21_04075 [Candidatus Kaiserbacteria bacterium RIFCSPHIGHO2_02_FULL_59_21]|uniref:Uncharacterized protein n=1 Tax=Candidatus Kaiserbacteria bacterium RIFCSPHIGHO2_02_FULL_59_21 TaxID=1798500 RepID=A0A1F6DZJ9_9BACT|nr:MAG: hypothetical protein A3C21_04075 [Candidatus Kaiserbacteria bacterium RIFCSPHIGHO2_02_FULL_59_21]